MTFVLRDNKRISPISHDHYEGTEGVMHDRFQESSQRCDFPTSNSPAAPAEQNHFPHIICELTGDCNSSPELNVPTVGPVRRETEITDFQRIFHPVLAWSVTNPETRHRLKAVVPLSMESYSMSSLIPTGIHRISLIIVR